MKLKKTAFATVALAGLAAMSGSAAAFDLTNCGNTGIFVNFNGTPNAAGTACPWVQYGDAQSFNLAVNSSLYDKTNGGGTGPTNPFYVDSTPGAIKDLIVNATGANGNPVNTNFPNMDNAYPTPNDQQNIVFFTTNKTAYTAAQLGSGAVMAPADPIPTGAWDTPDTWDTSLSALQGFLGTGNAPVFFFNNNQVNSGGTDNQSLAVWAQITLTSSTGAPTLVFDFINKHTTGAPGGTFFVDPLGGGQLLGNPGTYAHTGPVGTVDAGTNASTDYVLAGGQTCFDVTTGHLTLPVGGVCVPDNPGDTEEVVNNNLGANQAAYAVVFPELDAILALANFGGYDALHVDLRFGCDPNTIGFNLDSTGNCLARSSNNGYEQLFIAPISGTTVNVPEPATVALLGLGLLGLGLARRKTRPVL